MTDNKFFIGTIFMSIILHLSFLNINTDMFKIKESGIMIPVTLVQESLLPQKMLEIKKQQIEINLPTTKDDVYHKDANLNELAKRYTNFVVEEINNRKFSPRESKYYGLIGSVYISFIIDSYGNFSNIKVVRSSGNELLDKTGLNAVKETSGVVKRPVWAGQKKLRVIAVVKYQFRL